MFPQAHLRSVDVKILQQLLAVHEGIEAVKWLLEERSTLTSHCSSLTSSQYSLGEGPDTSWRGSWSSLHDPNDKLDNISIGSYLDTLADDMDEYCPSSSESVICSTTPLVSEAAGGGRNGGGPGAVVTAAATGVKSGAGSGVGIRAIESGAAAGNGTELNTGTVFISDVNGTGIAGTGTGKPAALDRAPEAKQDAAFRTKAAEAGKGSIAPRSNTQTQSIKVNGVVEKPTAQTGSPTRPPLSDKLGPKVKPYKNGKIDLDTCKMNGKRHLEYDAHWRWVQSQEDVTFL